MLGIIWPKMAGATTYFRPYIYDRTIRDTQLNINKDTAHASVTIFLLRRPFERR